MRHLLTSLALLATFAAAGQTTNPFPYNPDADADGWISVNDLLSLLSIFTSEFTPESWETDSLSAAVVLNGNISYFECQRSCHELEGHWRMADMDAFGKHWNLIAGENANHWVNSNSGLGNHDYDHFYEVNGNGNIYTVNSVDLSFGKKCMCHLQSSPFVPDVLTSETAGLQEQIDSLEMQLSQASQSISNLDSLLSSNVDGGGQGVDLNSLPQITSIECIEMGIGLSCSPQGGMCSNATLAPSNEGAYYLTHSCYTNFEPSFCTYPNWRKFVVHGTNLSDVSSIVKIHDNVQSNGYGGYVTSQSRDAATLLNQSDSSFVFYASRVDWEEIGLDNPISYWNSFPSDRMYRVALTIPAVGIIESPISIYFD